MNVVNGGEGGGVCGGEYGDAGGDCDRDWNFIYNKIVMSHDIRLKVYGW